MNRTGSFQIGLVLLVVFFLLMLTAFSTIEPFKESLDENRGADTLNCPGTIDFNQTDYDDDSSVEKLTRRPTCFITGISMIWFIFAILVAGISWVYINWSKTR